MPISTILIIVLSFLLGSIPFAVIIGKVFYGVDVRREGSGNPGATNTLRVLGKKAGLIVLLLDMLKGVAAVLLGRYFSGVNSLPVTAMELAGLCGALAIAGHVFSPFLMLKGGKGVATTMGVILALQPAFGGVLVLCFFSLLITTRFVSLGSIISAILYPVLEVLFNHPPSLILNSIALGIAVLITIKHKENIKRILAGKENKFSLKKSANQQAAKTQ